MSEDGERVAKAVADAREERGWSHSRLARELYLSHATINDLEAGHLPTRNVAARVEEFLGWPAGTMPTLDDDEDTSEAG